MVEIRTVLGTIDRLALERGERRGNTYHLVVTTGELLKAFELKPSIPHHRHIKGVVEMHYPQTTAEVIGRGDGANGFKLHVRIRSK